MVPKRGYLKCHLFCRTLLYGVMFALRLIGEERKERGGSLKGNKMRRIGILIANLVSDRPD